jgi:hypothetical protein
VDKKEALKTLRENRERHHKIVEEARVGYVAKAKAKLAAKLDELSSGKLVALRFDLQVPEDHTDDYDLAIRMVELHTEDTIEMTSTDVRTLMMDEWLHTEDTIEMTSTDVRTLMMDEWDWLRSFLFTNARYANSAAEYARTRGLDT